MLFRGVQEKNNYFLVYFNYEDLSKFAVPRLSVGIRWWEDVLGNGGARLYSDDILKKYNPKWNHELITQHQLSTEVKN